MISKEALKKLREEYPVGCTVELLEMNDMQAPPIHTKGVVRHVDDIGTIFVNWETGSGLGVAYGEDRCRRIN